MIRLALEGPFPGLESFKVFCCLGALQKEEGSMEGHVFCGSGLMGRA